MAPPPYTIFSLGDSALTIDFGNRIDAALNKTVIQLYNTIKAARLAGVKDIVPAYSSLTVYYEVIAVRQHNRTTLAFATIKQQLEGLLQQENTAPEQAARKLHIPVCYAEKYALDKEEMMQLTGLSFDEIVHIHTAQTYRVYMVGFLPGFAYMGEVDTHIAVPRKREPRTKIESGCVGIAGKQTGIYPLTSPGGWQIIGRTPVQLFNKEKEEPALFRAGDEITFFAIREDEFKDY